MAQRGCNTPQTLIHYICSKHITVMATRSRIGIQFKTGEIVSVYCHWDGYPEHNGRVLRTHYNTEEQVRELIDGGDLSALRTNAGWQNETLPTVGPLYYSTRGEDCPPRMDADLSEYLLAGTSEEYHYLYTDLYSEPKWVCYNMHQFDDSKLPEVVEIPVGAAV